jgi:F-type H+-transporting ATPase subunit epsilon
MPTMDIQLLDGRSEHRLTGITSFIAADASGQFGILPGHEPITTVVEPGLVRCRFADGQWHLLATTGGPMVFRHNLLQLVCARFLSADGEEALKMLLTHVLQEEWGERRSERQSWADMERELVKRLNEWSKVNLS